MTGSEHRPNARIASATRRVAAVATPRDLDRDLPGRGMAHGFEVGLTPVVFGAIGFLVDRSAGTSPVFTVAFVILGVVGLGLRYFYTYRYLMAEEDARGPVRPAARRRSRVGQR